MPTYATLAGQDAAASSSVAAALASDPAFLALAAYETSATLRRDAEDATKLQAGIDLAVAKGVLPGPADGFVPEPYAALDVAGKAPDAVCEEIVAGCGGAAAMRGKVLVICGLSGTGKGTTCAKLRERFAPNVTAWSNGNVFRSVTLCAATWCELHNGGTFDKEKALTKENIASFVSMLEFGKFGGKFDIRIRGLGLDALVSEIQNGELKGPKVSVNIPTVAEVTQGEVVLFAADAIRKMGEDGITVLLEGREQTVNYVRSPHRYTLMLSDESLIGKRRAAQRLMADAVTVLDGLPEGDRTDDRVMSVLKEVLEGMVKEIQ